MIEKETARGMRVPVKIYADDQLVSSMTEDRTIGQAVNVAALPGAQKHVVVLPDGHEGYGFPIGGVAATDLEEGVVSPGGVGYDINCGIRLIRTDLTESDVKEVMDCRDLGISFDTYSPLSITPATMNTAILCDIQIVIFVILPFVQYATVLL